MVFHEENRRDDLELSEEAVGVGFPLSANVDDPLPSSMILYSYVIAFNT